MEPDTINDIEVELETENDTTAAPEVAAPVQASQYEQYAPLLNRLNADPEFAQGVARLAFGDQPQQAPVAPDIFAGLPTGEELEALKYSDPARYEDIREERAVRRAQAALAPQFEARANVPVVASQIEREFATEYGQAWPSIRQDVLNAFGQMQRQQPELLRDPRNAVDVLRGIADARAYRTTRVGAQATPPVSARAIGGPAPTGNRVRLTVADQQAAEKFGMTPKEWAQMKQQGGNA